MTHREREQTAAKVDRLMKEVRRYGSADVPPLHIPPADPALGLDALIERLARIH